MRIPGFVAAGLLAACTSGQVQQPGSLPAPGAADYYGTLEPFAAEAVYFVVTDRFVDGDPSNNFPDQGPPGLRTFDRPIQLPGAAPANIGYLGGDFRGILDHADYIRDMGFTAIWATPIVDNPDEAFSGGIAPGGGVFTDKGKAGYHGYWGVNFFKVDEHLESPGLAFADFTAALREGHDLKFILDIVCNHGSPSYTMPVDQPGFGELYDASGRLVADHQNLHPAELDPANPLHAFFNRRPDIAELSDLDENNPDVLEYCVGAHGKWLQQGVAALRIDTIKHMPHAFWKTFSDRMRSLRPGLFMFAEAYSYDAKEIAAYTFAENGRISVLDFPGREAIDAVFARGESYASITRYLHLDSGVYANPYELMTFYDNHDMPRMAGDDDVYIDAHNWLFTSRGIPVVYYGSEMAFRAGAAEHAGNRDYFGSDNVALAKEHPVHAALRRVANLRRGSVALQRGLQVNLEYAQDTALFLRVFQRDGVAQTALIALNRSDGPVTVVARRRINPGRWRDAFDDGVGYVVDADSPELRLDVPAHGLRVLFNEESVADPGLVAELERLSAGAGRSTHE